MDGRKGAPSKCKTGASRGLVAPRPLKERLGPVLLVEGASEVAACETVGLNAVGRPSNTGGADYSAQLLRGRDVLVIGENDQKENGRWPGRDGAESVATKQATEWKTPVKWTLPPSGQKDVRAWLQDRVTRGLALADAEACHKAGMELLTELQSSATEMESEPGRNSADQLMRLALSLYRVGRTERDEPFAVAHAGPNVAIMFRGSRGGFCASLAREYRKQTSKTATASALTDAITCLLNDALDEEAEAVHLRDAPYNGGIVVDLGDKSGQAIVVHPGGWRLEPISPVVFRRTALTGSLPPPQRGGSLDLLRDLINVSDATWPLLIGWLIAAFIPDIPHPIAMLGGLQGAGKSSAAQICGSLFDPSPAALRSPHATRVRG